MLFLCSGSNSYSQLSRFPAPASSLADRMPLIQSLFVLPLQRCAVGRSVVSPRISGGGESLFSLETGASFTGVVMTAGDDSRRPPSPPPVVQRCRAEFRDIAQSSGSNSRSGSTFKFKARRWSDFVSSTADRYPGFTHKSVIWEVEQKSRRCKCIACPETESSLYHCNLYLGDLFLRGIALGNNYCRGKVFMHVGHEREGKTNCPFGTGNRIA